MLIDEFSFASPEYSLPRILAIRAIELASGQPRLKRLYRGYQAENLPHSAFWNEAVRLLNLDMRLYGSGFDKIPETGPLVVVANHPYGVLDGIAICWLVAQKRQDFKILINNVLCRAPEIEPHVLPVDFTESPEALATNLSARKQAREILDAGGTVIVFPAGGFPQLGGFGRARPKMTRGRRLSASSSAGQKPLSCQCFLKGRTVSLSKWPAMSAMRCVWR